MTGSAASSPASPVGLADPIAAVIAAVGALAGVDPTGLPVAAVGEQVTALGHLIDQLEAERLRRLAVFDRPVVPPPTAVRAPGRGCVSTPGSLRPRPASGSRSPVSSPTPGR